MNNCNLPEEPNNLFIVYMFYFQSQGYTALDTLQKWQRTYSRELDQEARQACISTERLLRKALAEGGEAVAASRPFSLSLLSSLYFHIFVTVSAAPAPVTPFDALQDSQLFDAENSEPLSASGGDGTSSQAWPQNISEVVPAPASPKRWQNNGSTHRHRHRQRGTESAVLYGVKK